MNFKQVISSLIGIYQIAYGVIFTFIAIWNINPITEFPVDFTPFSSLQIAALFVFSLFTEFSGLAIFINWNAGRQMAFIACLVNSTSDAYISYRYFLYGKELYLAEAHFHLIVAIISFVFGVLLCLKYFRTLDVE